jgi:rSAM/selenodomain-associated transferase 1
MPIRANALAVMAKAPTAGAVKTRLQPFLSAEEAADLARSLLLDQLSHLRAIETVDLYVAFTPLQEEALMKQLVPAPFQLFLQSEGDLGARMQNVFAQLFGKGHQAIVLIGADLMPVPLEYFAQAYDYLDGPEPRVVLGPSQDGGYYLVGLNRPMPAMFENMTWSHDQVFTQTVTKLADLGIETRQLPIWFDIDTPDDLQILMTRVDDPENVSMKNTLKLLRRLGGRRWHATKTS